MFVYKFGVAKLQCCLLMNGLVFDSNEVLIFLFLFFVFEKVKIRGGVVVVVIKHTKGHEVLLFTHPLLRSKTECFSFQKTGTRESRERGSIGERERGREREREREREQTTESLEEDFS
jgi:hypothetical protein